MKSFTAVVLLLAIMAITANAFVMPSSSTSRGLMTTTPSSTTTLNERRWNFNEGQSPWGLKQNAEKWNGRVAQMAFVWIFLQELVTGKGVIKGISEGDTVALINAGLFAVCLVGLVGWLAFQGDDDYTTN
eukprot:CAMPEP_0119567642 /NCGR_PEP_ID=MMETSP1352-20130426/36526_1 /TAXON_ID=265584 /ORGANISM="Stauroneis constricta, Strain CCMP1120" /LENGTH=129 /DNA_ID=CAMNT_0007616919 /DNA_START=87 /DNA_END=473 /DNA_ORIENTATION=-